MINSMIYELNDYELMIKKQVIKKQGENAKREYILTFNTDTGIGYLLDGKTRAVIMESEDFGLTEKDISKETRVAGITAILIYLILGAKAVVPDDSLRRDAIVRFAKRIADRMN